MYLLNYLGFIIFVLTKRHFIGFFLIFPLQEYIPLHNQVAPTQSWNVEENHANHTRAWCTNELRLTWKMNCFLWKARVELIIYLIFYGQICLSGLSNIWIRHTNYDCECNWYKTISFPSWYISIYNFLNASTQQRESEKESCVCINRVFLVFKLDEQCLSKGKEQFYNFSFPVHKQNQSASAAFRDILL